MQMTVSPVEAAGRGPAGSGGRKGGVTGGAYCKPLGEVLALEEGAASLAFIVLTSGTDLVDSSYSFAFSDGANEAQDSDFPAGTHFLCSLSCHRRTSPVRYPLVPGPVCHP